VLVDPALQERVADADVVVTGKVSAVRLPAETAPGPTMASAAPAAPKRISEHDPLWREAVIHVDSVVKGEHPDDTVVVRFPSSTDVRWHKAPKFHPGQEGVWMLRKQEVHTHPAAGLAAVPRAAGAVAAVPAYTALNPLDFQPAQLLPGIQTLAGPADA
jgi:hypothetical protein